MTTETVTATREMVEWFAHEVETGPHGSDLVWSVITFDYGDIPDTLTPSVLEDHYGFPHDEAHNAWITSHGETIDTIDDDTDPNIRAFLEQHSGDAENRAVIEAGCLQTVRVEDEDGDDETWVVFEVDLREIPYEDDLETDDDDDDWD